MDNRDSIIRKLQALNAKANDPSIKDTPEAIGAMIKFNELMKKYNVTLTELEIKKAGVGYGKGFTAKGKENQKYRNPIAYAVIGIANLTDTKLICAGFNAYQFVGTQADVQYAEFLYNMIMNATNRAFIAFKIGPTYSAILNNSRKSPQDIEWNYRYGFVAACSAAIQAMIKDKAGQGTGLILVKSELIAAFLNETGGKEAGVSKGVALKEEFTNIKAIGYLEGEKLKLRNEVEENNPNIAGLIG